MIKSPRGFAYHIREVLRCDGEDAAEQEIALRDKELSLPLVKILEDLIGWEHSMGGWTAPCWERAKAMLAKVAP